MLLGDFFGSFRVNMLNAMNTFRRSHPGNIPKQQTDEAVLTCINSGALSS